MAIGLIAAAAAAFVLFVLFGGSRLLVGRKKKGRKKKMIKTVLKIEGMMCGMCEAHICDAIRKAFPNAKKVSASRGKGEASFLTDSAVNAELLTAVIDATGYTCLAVESATYERKGWFGRK